MYGKIFEFGDTDPIAGEVSHSAALLYAALVHYARSDGVCEQWNMAMAALNVSYKQFKSLIGELEERGLVEEFSESTQIADLGYGFVMGTVKRIRIIDYELPTKIGRLSQSEWSKIRSEIFERDDYTCKYCGKRGSSLECDHVIPISEGGTNELGNLVTSCKSCNRSKRDKLIADWVKK